MRGINGIEFARTISNDIFVIFTTAFSEFAIDSYEVDAIDYLIKPIKLGRFKKAVEKAETYGKLLKSDEPINNIESVIDDHFFVKVERQIFKIFFKQILYIEGLKNYVILYQENSKVMT